MINSLRLFYEVITISKSIFVKTLVLGVIQIYAALTELLIVSTFGLLVSGKEVNYFNFTNNSLPYILLALIFTLFVSKFFIIRLTGFVSFSSVQILSIKFFKNQFQSDHLIKEFGADKVLTFLNNKLELIIHLLVLPVLNIFLASIVLFAFVLYIFIHNPYLLFMTAALVLFGYILPAVFLKRKVEKIAFDISSGITENLAILRTVIFFRREVKIWELDAHFIHEQKNSVTKLYQGKSRSYAISLYPRAVIETLVYSALAILIFGSLNNSELTLEKITNLLIGLFLILKALPYVQQIYFSLTHMRTGEDIFAEFKLFKNFNSKNENTKDFESNLIKNIELKEVNYYSDGKLLIQDFSYEINQNEKVAIVGPSGVGKSTLLDLICGFLVPSEGEILINGKDSRQKNLMKRIAYVPQKPYLFNDTILENITLADHLKQLVDIEALEDALNICGLSDINKSDADFLNRKTGDAGSLLSGGQMQRIALARAIYSGRKVLILDEFTSALDETTTNEIVASIIKLPITIIAVTHDSNVAAKFDKVIEMDWQ